MITVIINEASSGSDDDDEKSKEFVQNIVEAVNNFSFTPAETRNTIERKKEAKAMMDRLGIDMPQHRIKPQQGFIIANKFSIINISYDNDD